MVQRLPSILERVDLHRVTGFSSRVEYFSTVVLMPGMHFMKMQVNFSLVGFIDLS